MGDTIVLGNKDSHCALSSHMTTSRLWAEFSLKVPTIEDEIIQILALLPTARQ